MSTRKASACAKVPKRRLPRGRDRCAGCNSEQRAQLDADIVAKVPYRVLAERYGISYAAIFRHRKHVAVTLVPVKSVASTNAAFASSSTNGSDVDVDVDVEIRRLYNDTRAALDAAVEAGNLLGLSLAAREVHRSLDLLGRRRERLESQRGPAVVDVATLPDFVEMRTKLMAALAPFPEARLAVVEALKS